MANAGHATADPAAIPLTDAGVRQAEEFSRLLEEAPATIVCSPFLRARQTAQPVARRFGIEPVIWPIQEFTYLSPARCAGTTAAQRRNWVESYWRNAAPEDIDGPGAESFAQLVARVVETLERLESAEAGRRVLLVGHGQFMQAMRWWIARRPQRLEREHMAEFRALDQARHVPNCGGFSLLLRGGCWSGLE